MQYLGHTYTKKLFAFNLKIQTQLDTLYFYLLKLATLPLPPSISWSSNLCKRAVFCSCLYLFLRTTVLSLQLKAPVQGPRPSLLHCNRFSGWIPSAIHSTLWSEPLLSAQLGVHPGLSASLSPELSLSYLASRKPHHLQMTPRFWLGCVFLTGLWLLKGQGLLLHEA